MTTRTRKSITKVDRSLPSLVIEGGEVKVVEPVVLEEVEHEEVEEENGKPKHRISTRDGEAVYEYSGDCWQCKQENVVMPVFRCISHPIRADEVMGNQLAGFWNNGELVALCQKHYVARFGGVAKKSDVEYKVLEKRW